MELVTKIAEKIAGAGQEIRDIIVKKLSEVEIEKRVGLIVKAFNSLEALEKDAKKLDHADVITYQGGVESKSMSKKTFDEVAKLKGKIGELTKTIDNALEKNDKESYKKLNDFLSKDGKSKDTNTESGN